MADLAFSLDMHVWKHSKKSLFSKVVHFAPGSVNGNIKVVKMTTGISPAHWKHRCFNSCAVVFKNYEMSEQTTLNKMFQRSALIHLELNCTVVNESPGASLHEANWALEELKLAATPD